MRERTLWLGGFVLVAIALTVRLSVRERLVSIPAIRPPSPPIADDKSNIVKRFAGRPVPTRPVSSTQSVVVGTFDPLHWDDEITRQHMRGGAIIMPPIDTALETHPSTMIFGLPGFPNAYIRDTLMRHGSDHASMLPLSMPNDWTPKQHGPESAPGDGQHGKLNDDIPDFRGGL